VLKVLKTFKNHVKWGLEGAKFSTLVCWKLVESVENFVENRKGCWKCWKIVENLLKNCWKLF